MNVLSLFDGISCGQIALERAGIKVDKYFASEVDKHAIKVTQHNYPNTVQLGDVRNIDTNDLPEIKLLIGGSPCQSFSFAGKREGMVTDDDVEILTLDHYLQLKGEGFQFKGQSYLFWEYVRILKEVKPEHFLLENVRMKKKWQDVISGTLGVEPVLINSALVSAQSRGRLYWTSAENVSQPEDRGILLKDIVEENDIDGVYIVPRGTNNGGLKHYDGKSPTLTTSNWEHNIFLAKRIEDQFKNLLENSKYRDDFIWKFDRMGRAVLLRPDGKKIQRIGAVANKNSKVEILTCSNMPFVDNGIEIRRVKPVEAERLQTVPENYTSVISDNQRFKCLGNGWTVDVIVHILKHMQFS